MSVRESAKYRRDSRLRRSQRVRRRVSGSAEKPRLSVHRSNKHIFAQLIDDESGITLASAHDLRMDPPEIEGADGKVARARAVGQAVAEKAKGKGIETIVFDRSGYRYHGRIAALAEGAREGGLKF
ncbi:MAG TPA: 50S ribosomal protein L18 [Candidatus Krumholzibacteria bacterium]|nr:50S ribosomal protein L18 [Candidatus Krumholzibacteria bacterium]